MTYRNFTAHTMAFALGLLALYPEKQQAFYNEIIRECRDSNNINDSRVIVVRMT